MGDLPELMYLIMGHILVPYVRIYGVLPLMSTAEPNHQSLLLSLARKITPSQFLEFTTTFTSSLGAVSLFLSPFQCMLLLSS